MTDKEIRTAILKTLREKHRNEGGYSDMDMHGFQHLLDVEVKRVEAEVDYLVGKGFVEFPGGVAQIGITTRGIDFVDGPSEFNPPAEFYRQSIEIHGGQIGQINQAHMINNPSLLLDRLSELIENNPNIDPEKKKEWKKTLDEISRHPLVVEAIRVLLSGFGL